MSPPPREERPTAHVVVVSDRSARGERSDATGPRLIGELLRLGYSTDPGAITVVPDEVASIASALRELAGRGVRLIVTTGGTGAAPRDVTPEATRSVVERELPGFGELMRARSLEKTPHAAGSRAIAGTAGTTLVINLPGSPGGAVECLGFVAEAARHVLDLVGGTVRDCVPPAAEP